ncbi:hypothetical protein L228DRAFT_243787 [Xylona heveae TC161]|uniref:Uncharacterized protein n=1 Tax=Xylona heveae (strain CBS 132557 / TC161) TaxID=1328760 RepID=A0A165IK56_XYLHT|nr:hypothetical protein L228DRAFT_243787 [Xylona heveae TC161]KZF25010.1 hypothetical protein L228DRAFT_243787 [Xylona heveae TC161]
MGNGFGCGSVLNEIVRRMNPWQSRRGRFHPRVNGKKQRLQSKNVEVKRHQSRARQSGGCCGFLTGREINYRSGTICAPSQALLSKARFKWSSPHTWLRRGLLVQRCCKHAFQILWVREWNEEEAFDKARPFFSIILDHQVTLVSDNSHCVIVPNAEILSFLLSFPLRRTVGSDFLGRHYDGVGRLFRFVGRRGEEVFVQIQ